ARDRHLSDFLPGLPDALDNLVAPALARRRRSQWCRFGALHVLCDGHSWQLHVRHALHRGISSLEYHDRRRSMAGTAWALGAPAPTIPPRMARHALPDARRHCPDTQLSMV